MFGSVNFGAVLAAALVEMLVGALWYSKKAFGKEWMKLANIDQKDVNKAKKSGEIKKSYIMMFVSAFAAAYVLGLILSLFRNVTIGFGATLGFLAGIGFVATMKVSDFAFEKKPFKLYLITVGHAIIGLTLAGAVLAAWR